jgi:hypothetical protein
LVALGRKHVIANRSPPESLHVGQSLLIAAPASVQSTGAIGQFQSLDS